MAVTLIPNETYNFPNFYFKVQDVLNDGKFVYIMKLEEFIHVNK